MSNLDILKAEAREKFRRIGEGSVRFMATRMECNEFVEELITHVYRQAITDAIDEDTCWNWQGYVNPKGYGVKSWRIEGKKVNKFAHRLVYEAFMGKIPEDLVIDHLCRNHRCVNPWHLEPVTSKENILRGVGASAKNAKKTHCNNGHSLEGKNLISYRGTRDCRICKYDRTNKTRATQRKAITNLKGLMPGE